MATADERDAAGGDPACWGNRVCPACGRLNAADRPVTCEACGAAFEGDAPDPAMARLTDGLRSVLAGRFAAIRADHERLVADPLFKPVTDLSQEEHRSRVREQLRALGRDGAARVGFPREYGGGGDIGAAVAAFGLLAFADLSLLVKAGVQWGLFGGAVQHLGTERHHRRYLPAIMSAELLGCFAMTETGHGSDVHQLRTTASYDPGSAEFVLTTPDEDARKDYIGGAAQDAELAVVFAQLIVGGHSQGVHAFLVPIRGPGGTPAPGVRIEDCGAKGGLAGVDNGRLTFDEVRVPREALLNRYGDVSADGEYDSPIADETKRFFVMLGTLVQGRISVAGGALSAAQLALAIAVRYAAVRRQFRAPGADEDIVILDFLAHQRRLLPALASTYAFHFAQRHLVDELQRLYADGADQTEEEAGQDRRRLEAQAAGIKALGTWHAVHTIQTCREACGGAGYLAENRLTQLRADTDVFTTFEGDNTVLLQLMAKGLLTEYRDEFGSLDTLGMVRFVADHVVQAVLERSGVGQLTERLAGSVRPPESADVRDRGWHRELFEWREQHVVDALARRIRRQVKGGTDLFAVFNAVQDHVLAAARASTERVVLEAFAAAVDGCPEPDVANVLSACCALHALSVIERDRGWFLEHGRLTPERSKAVTGAVNDLCAELRPRALVLVDGFDIPDSALAAPIALGAEADRQRMRRQAPDPLPGR